MWRRVGELRSTTLRRSCARRTSGLSPAFFSRPCSSSSAASFAASSVRDTVPFLSVSTAAKIAASFSSDGFGGGAGVGAGSSSRTTVCMLLRKSEFGGSMIDHAADGGGSAPLERRRLRRCGGLRLASVSFCTRYAVYQKLSRSPAAPVSGTHWRHLAALLPIVALLQLVPVLGGLTLPWLAPRR